MIDEAKLWEFLASFFNAAVSFLVEKSSANFGHVVPSFINVYANI